MLRILQYFRHEILFIFQNTQKQDNGARRGTVVNMFSIFVTFFSWITGLSSAQILTSRYQSIVDNRLKIDCTSNAVDVMEYSTLNHYIVL